MTTGLELEIVNCDATTFRERADEFVKLCHSSFKEHLKKGVKMGPCCMTKEKWLDLSKDCIGQYIEDSGNIIAFWIAKPDFDKNETFGKILAVNPEYKGKHIGLTLANSRANFLRDFGMTVFWTDTSLKAPHVVNFHKKYGCKIVGMKSWSNTNYYSVQFRQALVPEYELNDLEAKTRFFFSKIRCKSLLREDGRRTLIGEAYLWLKAKLSKIKSLIS